nr:FadR/GntR family transcriptional regulator [uncultured Oscillibacter sp.]
MKKQRGNATLTDTAVDDIIQLILDRNMKQGDRLPNEYDLARQLGIGRSTLREAIRRLVSRNILQVRQGAGTFVSDKRGVPEDPLGLTFMGHDPDLALDLLDIRLMLEPEICAIVAQRATEAQMEQLRRHCDELSRLIEYDQDYSEADASFHLCLAECSNNRVLRNLIPVITSSVSVIIATTKDEYRLLTNQQHRQIVDAICRRDAAGARYNMIVHLNTNRESVASSMTAAKNR